MKKVASFSFKTKRSLSMSSDKDGEEQFILIFPNTWMLYWGNVHKFLILLLIIVKAL